MCEEDIFMCVHVYLVLYIVLFLLFKFNWISRSVISTNNNWTGYSLNKVGAQLGCVGCANTQPHPFRMTWIQWFVSRKCRPLCILKNLAKSLRGVIMSTVAREKFPVPIRYILIFLLQSPNLHFGRSLYLTYILPFFI